MLDLISEKVIFFIEEDVFLRDIVIIFFINNSILEY